VAIVAILVRYTDLSEFGTETGSSAATVSRLPAEGASAWVLVRRQSGSEIMAVSGSVKGQVFAVGSGATYAVNPAGTLLAIVESEDDDDIRVRIVSASTRRVVSSVKLSGRLWETYGSLSRSILFSRDGSSVAVMAGTEQPSVPKVAVLDVDNLAFVSDWQTILTCASTTELVFASERYGVLLNCNERVPHLIRLQDHSEFSGAMAVSLRGAIQLKDSLLLATTDTMIELELDDAGVTVRANPAFTCDGCQYIGSVGAIEPRSLLAFRSAKGESTNTLRSDGSTMRLAGDVGEHPFLYDSCTQQGVLSVIGTGVVLTSVVGVELVFNDPSVIEVSLLSVVGGSDDCGRGE
jgi:hypothetical protein